MSAKPLAAPQEPQITQTSSSGQGEDHEKYSVVHGEAGVSPAHDFLNQCLRDQLLLEKKSEDLPGEYLGEEAIRKIHGPGRQNYLAKVKGLRIKCISF
jgi:hypothetical protein